MSVHEHRKAAPALVRAFLMTVSDTRTVETDSSGQLLRTLFEQAGHTVTDHIIVKDEAAQIQAGIRAALAGNETDVIVLTGGTGITARDVTIEAVRPFLDKELVGYGELFRMLSWHEIGPAAMLSRATAGVAGNTLIIATPGSSAAVKLAMEKLILPEVGHLLREARRVR